MLMYTNIAIDPDNVDPLTLTVYTMNGKSDTWSHCGRGRVRERRGGVYSGDGSGAQLRLLLSPCLVVITAQIISYCHANNAFHRAQRQLSHIQFYATMWGSNCIIEV